MGLSFKSSIKPEEYKKVGRNEPCPCDSGKKYKKCCLFKQEKQQDQEDQQAYSASKKQGKIGKVVEWVTSQTWSKWYLEAYFNRYYPDLTMEESEVSAIMDLAIFEGLVGSKTPLEMFVAQANLTDLEQKYYQDWVDNHVFSLFKVQEVNLGKSILIKDLVSKSGKAYFVLEKQGSYTMSVGTVIAARLVSHYDDWMMSGGANFALPDEVAQIFENNSSLLSENFTQEKFMLHTLPQFSHIDNDLPIEDDYDVDTTNYALELLAKELNVTEVLKVCSPVALKDLNVKGDNLSSDKSFKNNLQIIISKCSNQSQVTRFFNLLKRLGDLVGVNKEFDVGTFDSNNDEVEELELTTNFTDFGEGLSSEQNKTYNKATKLMQDRKPLLAIQKFAKLMPVVSAMNESFRWYGNIGTCLSMLGQLELAKPFLKKSLSINPDYDIAQKNLKNFDDDKIKDQLTNQGSMYFWSMFCRTKWKLNLANDANDAGNSGNTDNDNDVDSKKLMNKLLKKSKPSLLQDMIALLGYLDECKVSLTPKRKDIPLKIVKIINKLFVVPDSEVMSYSGGYKKSAYKFSKESEFSQLRLLRMVALFTGWVKITTTEYKTSRSILSITAKGKKWLKKPTLDQFSILLTAWWGDTAWEEIYNFHNLATSFTESFLAFYQDSLFVCLQNLYQVNGWLSLKKIMDSFSSMADELEVFLSTNMFERDVLIPLTRAGLVEPKYQDLVFIRGKISFDDNLDDRREQSYKMTTLGKQVFVVLEERLREMVPKEILQMDL